MQTNQMKTSVPTLSRVAKCLSLLMICLAAGLLGGCHDTINDGDIQFATLTQTRAMLQDKPGVARAIDVRTAKDYAEAHIPNALNLDLALVSENKDSIDPALARYKSVIVYGQDPGSATARAMSKRLMRTGHGGVFMFSGGMAEWTGAGLKTDGTGVKAAPAAPPVPPQTTPAPK